MTPKAAASDITRLVGNTPLLRVHLFERDFPRVEVYAKAEWFNPGGSVKDRAALSMIEDGVPPVLRLPLRRISTRWP